MTALGFTLAGRGHPIIPVMLGDARLTQDFAERMLARGIFVIGFSFPVVPRGQARIRTQMSAAHAAGGRRRRRGGLRRDRARTRSDRMSFFGLPVDRPR